MGEIEYPQAPLGGRFCVVDDGQYIRANLRAARLQALQCRQSSIQGLRGKSGRQFQQSEEPRVGKFHRRACDRKRGRVRNQGRKNNGQGKLLSHTSQPSVTHTSEKFYFSKRIPMLPHEVEGAVLGSVLNLR